MCQMKSEDRSQLLKVAKKLIEDCICIWIPLLKYLQLNCVEEL